jgi:hypothetical protein
MREMATIVIVAASIACLAAVAEARPPVGHEVGSEPCTVPARDLCADDCIDMRQKTHNTSSERHCECSHAAQAAIGGRHLQQYSNYGQPYPVTENNGAADDSVVGWSSNDADGYSAVTAPCTDSSLTRCHGRCACMRAPRVALLHTAAHQPARKAGLHKRGWSA